MIDVLTHFGQSITVLREFQDKYLNKKNFNTDKHLRQITKINLIQSDIYWQCLEIQTENIWAPTIISFVSTADCTACYSWRKSSKKYITIRLSKTTVRVSVCGCVGVWVCPKFYILLLSLLFSFIYPTVSSSVIHF